MVGKLWIYGISWGYGIYSLLRGCRPGFVNVYNYGNNFHKLGYVPYKFGGTAHPSTIRCLGRRNYNLVNVYITMENHHFYGKSTINTIYTKVSSEPPDRIENCDFVPVEHWNWRAKDGEVTRNLCMCSGKFWAKTGGQQWQRRGCNQAKWEDVANVHSHVFGGICGYLPGTLWITQRDDNDFSLEQQRFWLQFWQDSTTIIYAKCFLWLQSVVWQSSPSMLYIYSQILRRDDVNLRF